MIEGGGQIGADGPLYNVLIDAVALIEGRAPIGAGYLIDAVGSIGAVVQGSDLMAHLREDGAQIDDRDSIDGVGLTDAGEAETNILLSGN